MPETQLVWDAESRSVSVGDTIEGIREVSAENVRERIENAIFTFVRENPDTARDEIVSAVHGNGTTKYAVFKRMVESGLLERNGAGVKNSPYRYCVPALPYLTESAAVLAA